MSPLARLRRWLNPTKEVFSIGVSCEVCRMRASISGPIESRVEARAHQITRDHEKRCTKGAGE